MSYTTTAILFFDVQENFEPDFADRVDHPIIHVNSWLEASYGDKLVSLSEALKVGFSGSESIWVGMFSYLDNNAFLKIVRSQHWRIPECVAAIIKGEEDEQLSLSKVEPR